MDPSHSLTRKVYETGRRKSGPSKATTRTKTLQGPPRWAAKRDQHHHDFPTAEEVVSLNLDGSQWDRVQVAAFERDALGTAGKHAVLTYNVMVRRRRSA